MEPLEALFPAPERPSDRTDDGKKANWDIFPLQAPNMDWRMFDGGGEKVVVDELERALHTSVSDQRTLWPPKATRNFVLQQHVGMKDGVEYDELPAELLDPG